MWTHFMTQHIKSIYTHISIATAHPTWEPEPPHSELHAPENFCPCWDGDPDTPAQKALCPASFWTSSASPHVVQAL